MKQTLKLITATLVLALSIASCDNVLTKEWGGTSYIDLPKGEKLVNITWKKNDLWYLTRPMVSSDSPSTYKFVEKSQFGVFSGCVVVRERR